MEKVKQRVDIMINKFILDDVKRMYSKTVRLYLACMQKNEQFWAK